MTHPTHTPVLLQTALKVLAPKPGESVLDVTLGLGGHSEAFLHATSPDGRLTALDADTGNLKQATERLKPFGERAILMHANFGQLPQLAIDPVDIVFADLGLSSPHLDDASRGFSFRFDGPLDLRFDQTQGESASEFLSRVTEDELTFFLREYGELFREARRIAQFIKEQPIATTTDLRGAVERALGWRAKASMAQVFQALRIAVNDELAALETLLTHGVSLLKPGGRFGVISYHSLEDRPVKQHFKTLSTPIKDDLTGKVAIPASYRLLTPKAVVPEDGEIAENPRARSAKFRVLERVL